MDSYEESRRNDREGLRFIHNFGWLRTAELGGLMWPKNKSSRQQADRLSRRWVARNLVIVRKLPDGAGRALVLSTAGVRVLAEHGIKATSGKDVGQVRGATWTPPAAWRHDLIACGVLVELHKRGYTIFPEHQIRRLSGRLAKIPDGLAVNGPDVFWLEVENARKSGPEMRQLAEALGRVEKGIAEKVLGYAPNKIIVAFAPAAKDEREHKLDHLTRVRNAIAKHNRKTVSLVWAKCQISGAVGVKSVVFENDNIGADRAAAIALKLNVSGWRVNPEGGFMSHYAGQVAQVWEDEDGWAYMVEEGGAQHAADITEAKRGCAEALVARGL